MNALRKPALAALLIACATTAGTGHAQIAFRAATQSGLAAAGASTITHVGAGAVATNDGGCPRSVTPAIPGGLTGDLLIALVNSREDSSTITASATWTQLYGATYGGGGQEFEVYIYYRFATGADAFTFTQSGTCGTLSARVARFRGVDPTTPFYNLPVPVGNVVEQNANNIDTGTETTTEPDAMLLVASFVNDDNFVCEAGGWNVSFETQSNLNRDLSLNLHYQLQTTAGAKQITNWPIDANSNACPSPDTDENFGIIFALRPQVLDLIIAVPAGTLVNDVMIASIAARPCSNTSGGACTTTITPPPEWTLVNSFNQTTGGGTGGYGNILYVYRRVVTGPEPAPYAWRFGGAPVNNGAVGGILSFSGVDTANPIVADAGQVTPSAATHTAPSINTGTETNTMLVGSFAANSSATWTPGTMTEAVDVPSLPVNDDLGLAIEMNYEARAAAGATGTRTATKSTPPANDAGATHLLALRPAASVNHYAISVLSTTVANCDYAEVTITAHNAAHTAVNPPASRIVTLSVSAGVATAVWQPTLVVGTGGWTPAGATATYQWPGNESTFTVRLRQSAVISLTVNANDTFVTEAPAEDPAISFVNSVFRISNGANAALSIGTQLAGKPSNTGVGTQSLFLQAIRTDTVTGSCTSIFPSGSEVDIGVGAQCNNPATCTQNVTLTTTSGTGSPTGSFVPAGAGTYPATIRFRFTTANAEAPFYFSYADAGQITLQFRHITAAPAVTIAGTSNAFVVRPFGLAFPGVNHSSTAAGTLIGAAGDAFTMAVQAYRWASGEDGNNDGVPDAGVNITDNGTVPNFAATASVGVSANLPGVALGAMSRGAGCAVAADVALTGGTSNANDWCYSETGNVILTANVSNYLAAGVNITGNSGLDGVAGGGYVGRFRPKNFAISGIPTLTNRSAAICAPASAFTYMNEGLALAFTLVARNTQGATTQNYSGVYAKLGIGTFANFNFGAKSGTTNLIARVDSGVNPVGSWSNGVAAITATTGIRRATPDNPDGPYTAVQFGIAPVDSDGVAMNTLDFDADGNTVNERANLGVTTEVRFGRLRLGNAHGSELLDLPLPVKAEYYDGNAFVINTGDSCTTLSASDIRFDFVAGTPNLVACETLLNPAGTITFNAGVAAAKLTKPGAGNNGSVDLTVNLGALSGSTCTSASSSPATGAGKPYLQGNWGSGTYTDNPRARATFGVYKNADEFIYQRENF